MTDLDPTAKAAEIDATLKAKRAKDAKAAADAKAKADADADEDCGKDKEREKTDARLDAMEARLDASLSKLDAFLAKSDARGKRDGADITDQDGANKDLDGRPVKEGATENAGEARQLVADSRNFFSDQKLRAELGNARHRADALYSAFSQSAPLPMQGEDPLAYRNRLIRPLQQHSKQFAAVDLDSLSGAMFDGVENSIFNDAKMVADHPEMLCGPNELRAVTHVDGTGRHITQYYGDPRSWMDDFASPVVKRLTKINTRPQDRY
jgi:hypothetical protein